MKLKTHISRDTGDDEAEFTKIQRDFEIVRVVIATTSGLLMGFVTDASMKIWDYPFLVSRKKDVQRTLLRIGFYQT